ncbi:hypothetical protein [Streptomyces flaveolus]|uniref:hypothetical protein n=1 Tax=Streptomyces flaveolus TaxID=67297 RepID=UPI0033FE784E
MTSSSPEATAPDRPTVSSMRRALKRAANGVSLDVDEAAPDAERGVEQAGGRVREQHGVPGVGARQAGGRVPVQGHLHVRERVASGADVACVVRPAILVLVAAHRYVTEEDVAVLPQARRVEKLVGVHRHQGVRRQVREEGACCTPGVMGMA